MDKIIPVFWELGFDAADTQTLSAKTGFSKPSLYKAFGSKEDLFVAALNRYNQTYSHSTLDALTNAATPRQGIHDFFCRLAKDVAGPGHPTGCLIMSLAIPLRCRLPKVAEALSTIPQESMRRMTTYFAEQKEQGHLPGSFDCAAAIVLMRDLSAAMAAHARGGVPLEVLESKVARNTNLVLLEGCGAVAALHNEPTA